jgi:hypothetical protein
MVEKKTREGLTAARAKGKKLGRPKGALGKSRLDGKEQEIRLFLQKRVSKASLARIMDGLTHAKHQRTLLSRALQLLQLSLHPNLISADINDTAPSNSSEVKLINTAISCSRTWSSGEGFDCPRFPDP